MIRRAVILAAGRGTRLGSLTARRPKPMIPVCGRPVLEQILVGLHAAGIEEAAIVVGYRGQAIRSGIGDGSQCGVRVSYLDQPVPTGTGAALLLARDWAQSEPVIMSYGDILTDPAHYQQVVDAYSASPCAGAIGMNEVDDPWQGGAVYFNEERVTQVIEKPPVGTSTTNWNLAGIYAFGSQIWPVLETLEPSPRGELELTAAIHALLEQNETLRPVQLKGFWSDIGTPEALYEARRVWRTRLSR
jgi:dTDP-glucose pyrophosphorylase